MKTYACETYECDNVSNCHDLITIGEDDDAMRVYCKQCHYQYVIRKDYRGVPEMREYARLFKRDILQGRENLFYKVYSQHIRT